MSMNKPMMKMTPEMIIRKYEQMGFASQQVWFAFDRCKGDDTQMLDILFSMNNIGTNNEDMDITKAIELSLKEQKNFNQGTYEPLNAEQRLKKPGMPVGLKNVGNSKLNNLVLRLACYVNSLLQFYFMNPKFVQAILDFDADLQMHEDLTSPHKNKGEQDIKKASVSLIKHLQKLFAKMIRSQKKYVDPTEVLNSVCDDLGEHIPIGDQKDVTEYHLNFLSRVEEGLYYQEKYKKMFNNFGFQNQTPTPDGEDTPTGYVSVSTGKFSSSLRQENGLIMKQFFGKMKQFRSYVQDNEKVIAEEDVTFGPIIVDTTHKELYSALENYCTYTIDDFRAPNGEKTIANGNLWFTRPPECLVFQLQRVTFDKINGTPIKINDQFKFEKEIYLDRFMLQHREEAVQINKKIKDLKDQLDQKERCLSKMNSYKDSSLNIINMLGISTEFLKNQLDFDMNSGKLKENDPTIVGQLDERPNIETAVKVLSQYGTHLQTKTDDLKRTITAIKDEINKLNSRLGQIKYHLVSILIHDGVAGSGHYYSFNRNVVNGSWKRFNDIYVTDENEEVVMTEAFGGPGNTSAYCLVYLSDSTIQEELILSKKPINAEIQNEVEKIHYNLLLKPKQIDEVEADNIIFHEEREEFRFNNCLKTIIDNYKLRYDMVTQALQSKTTKSPPTHLNSFGNFLRYDPHFENLVKWYILDCCLQDSPLKTSLRQLKSSRNMLTMLSNRLSSFSRPYAYTHLILSKEEENKLDCKLAEYSAEFPILIYTKFLMTSALEERWADVCYASKSILDMETNPQSFIHKLVKDIAKIITIKLSLSIEKQIRAAQYDSANELLNYLVAITKGILRPEDVQNAQAKAVIKDALSETLVNIPDEALSKLKEGLHRLNTSFHVSAEIDRVLGNYSPQALDLEIQAFSTENLYVWKDINEFSGSNIIKNLMNSFTQTLKLYVDFHNMIHTQKAPLKLEDRKKFKFIL